MPFSPFTSPTLNRCSKNTAKLSIAGRPATPSVRLCKTDRCSVYTVVSLSTEDSVGSRKVKNRITPGKEWLNSTGGQDNW